MTDQGLHEQLSAISDQVRPVDLYERSLRRSSQIGRRRTAAGLVGTAAGIVVVLVVSWQLLGRPLAAPGPVPATHPPTTPSPTAPEPTPAEPLPGPLDNATLKVAPWPRYGDLGNCGTGPFQIVGGQSPVEGKQLTVFVWSSIELTLNGTPGYAAVVSCFGPGEGRVEQVLAYQQTTDGPALIGRVVASDGVDITGFEKLSSPAPDEVSVDVVEQTVPGSAPPAYAILHQQRTYRLSAGAFRQVAGDTTFHATPAGLTLQAGPLAYGPAVQGCRSGTMTLTIHNGGTQVAAELTAAIINPPRFDECPAPFGQAYDSVLVQIGALGPGESRTVTVHATAADPTAEGPIAGGTTEDLAYHYILLRTGQKQYPGSTHYLVSYQ